jgi:hypothetical protein
MRLYGKDYGRLSVFYILVTSDVYSRVGLILEYPEPIFLIK